MSVVIEQTQSEMQDSHAFSRRAAIAGVRVSEATFSNVKALSLEQDEALLVGIRYALRGTLVEKESIEATTLFECVITESAGSGEADPIVKIECALTATYDIQQGFNPSEAELNAFHKANVIFNCWPYFREFVQSAACRMNIPPPPVPFVRVHIVADKPALTISEKVRKARGRPSGKKLK